MQFRVKRSWRWVLALAYGVSLCGSAQSCSNGTDDVTPGGMPAQNADASTVDATADGPLDAGLEASDGSTPAVAGYPAPHPSFPRVETNGGPVMISPNVVPVFFANDPVEGQVEQFLAQLAGSSYWSATTGEYGVGPLTVAPSIVVTDVAPESITSAQVSAWFAGYLDGTHAAWPTVGPNNVYVVFYPQATSVVQANGSTSCVDFGGYHAEGHTGADEDGAAAGDDGGEAGADAEGVPGQAFVYAVIPRCASFNTLTGIDSVTAALSHELIESATDPLAATAPAYRYIDFDEAAWAIGGGDRELFLDEVGDICEAAESPDRIFRPLVGGFTVQRTWSNHAAAADLDPCVPAIPCVYVGAAPEFDDLVLLPNDGGFPNGVLTTGAKLAIGESQTFDVHLFSMGPTPDWYVTVYQELPAAGAAPTIRAELDRPTGNNGDVRRLTITRIAGGPAYGGTVVFLTSSPAPPPATGLPDSYNAWFGFIGN